MRKKLLTILLTSVFVLGGVTPSFAQVLDGENEQLENEHFEMYASKGHANNDSLNKAILPTRANVENALGEFDALQNGYENKFYSVASHNFSVFKFGDDDDKDFHNREDKVDIKFCEVTWGNYWHEEAVEVYLINPKIKGLNNSEKKYSQNDYKISNTNDVINENDNLYFAGVAFNKMVNTEEKVDRYRAYENKRFNEIKETWNAEDQSMQRTFVDNELSQDGNFQITGFNLPEEVVSAEGIVLVDITKKVNLDFHNKILPANDDGFDLDAIQVWGKEDSITDDSEGEIFESGSATGEGIEIPSAKWFKQTEIKYSELKENGKLTFNIISGAKETVVGTYTVELKDDNTIYVTYNMNGGVKVDKEHLGISNSKFESHNQGASNNANKESFNADIDLSKHNIYDDTEYFYVYAHFSK